LTANAILWRRVGVPDRDICVAGVKVEDSVRADYFEGDTGVLFSPSWKTGHQPAAGKSVRRRDAQGRVFAVRSYRGEGGTKRLETIANNREKQRSGLGKLEWAGVAAEEAASTITLEQSNLMADRRRRDAQFGRGLLKAHMAPRCFKGAQLDEGRQLLHRFDSR